MIYTEKKKWIKSPSAKIVRLRVSQISPNPNQPRKVFDEASLRELAESIRTYGVIQPITVCKCAADRYQLIMGERRLRASLLAGESTIPCIIVDTNEKDSAVLALIENLQRQNLSFFEEAQAIHNIMEKTGITQGEAARLISKTQPAVANKLRLLKIDPAMQQEIEENGLSERHARALLRLEEEGLRRQALRLMIERRLNVAQSEALVDSLLAGTQKKPAKKECRIFKDVRIFVNSINHAIKVMKDSGIEAKTNMIQNDEYIEYVIKIPL